MSVALNDQNRVLATKLVVIVAGMLGFAFAMVPMYRQVCEALGISQSRIVAPSNSQVDASRELTVDLLASTAGLPWRFEAIDRSVRLHPGELVTVRYRVVNTLGRPVTAHAVMSTAPIEAAQWISKQQCFCFTDQTLQPGEEREMPVVFRVLPEAPRDLEAIALSYTFLEAPGHAR
ncbi:MAG TPA: cytochrome c oxidase assembly protein [Usitatibacter sp.]|nr:cytochrome c oxidase assembly protein [Usitatibacter sp.]